MITFLKTTLSIIKRFWATGFYSELEYKFNLYIEIIAVLANLTGSIFILSLFYSEEARLGGWSWYESLIVLGFYTILEGITTSLLQPNLSKIVQHVQHGTLDFVLLKPVDSQLWLSVRMFSPWGIPSLFSGTAVIIFSIYRSSLAVNIQSFLLSFLMLFTSLVILYSLWFILATTSIWFVRVWNATEVLRSILVAGRYPISSYPYALRIFFTFFLPIAFLTTVPAEALTSRSSSIIILISITLAALFFITSRLFWLYALRFYSSASS